MANLFSSSIGRKLVMSISGLFLISFLLIHLTINSFLLLDGLFGLETGNLFNAGAHFMATNPIIKIVEPILGLGFLFHIVYSLILSFQNMRARGNQSYASGSKTSDVEWSSKNMLILGVAVTAFLVVHLINFYIKMKFTGDALLAEVEFPFFGEIAKGHNSYALVNAAFDNVMLVVCYAVGSIALGYHLSHGFWSAFQTIGISNGVWLPRLRCISVTLAWIIGGGFTLIAVLQYLLF